MPSGTTIQGEQAEHIQTENFLTYVQNATDVTVANAEPANKAHQGLVVRDLITICCIVTPNDVTEMHGV